jgi:hypothetical protein
MALRRWPSMFRDSVKNMVKKKHQSVIEDLGDFW